MGRPPRRRRRRTRPTARTRRRTTRRRRRKTRRVRTRTKRTERRKRRKSSTGEKLCKSVRYTVQRSIGRDVLLWFFSEVLSSLGLIHQLLCRLCSPIEGQNFSD